MYCYNGDYNSTDLYIGCLNNVDLRFTQPYTYITWIHGINNIAGEPVCYSVLLYLSNIAYEKGHALLHRSFCSLRGDKVSTCMLTHTYPHKPLRKIKWPSAITRLTAHFTCGLMSDLAVCRCLHRKNMVIHDIECLCWPGVIKQHNPPIFPTLPIHPYIYTSIHVER